MQSRLIFAFCCATVAIAQEAPKPQLTARELFYAAVQAAAKPAAAPARPQAKAPAAAAAPKKAATQEVVRAESKSMPSPAAPQHAELPEGARIVPAMAKTGGGSAGPALGLKYSVLKKSGDEMVEVPANTVFHAGDRIQISVQTNVPGYLYIVSQGSSGTWKPMFPSPEVADGNNHVDGFRNYVLPPQSRILFDEQTGTEKLFLVFSREPEPSLERMIYSLQGGQPAAAPNKEEAAPAKTLLVMANPKIDDRTVGILRTTYARDLVIEKVDEKTPGERKETAVYVVNPTGSSDSRVVADLQLVHQ